MGFSAPTLEGALHMRLINGPFPHGCYLCCVSSYWGGSGSFSCCSVAKPCSTLCGPVNCGTPGFPVLHYLPGVCSNSCPLSLWCHPTISSYVSPFSSCSPSFLASGSFPTSQLFASGMQSIRASASASVLPMNIQGWFPLGLTSLISLLSKGLSRVSSSTTVQKHQFFGTQPSLQVAKEKSLASLSTHTRNTCRPSASSGNWFQDPLGHQNPWMLKLLI